LALVESNDVGLVLQLASQCLDRARECQGIITLSLSFMHSCIDSSFSGL
jgi:hypothetical protein